MTDSLVRYIAVVGTQEECRERLADILTLQPGEVTFLILAEDISKQLENLASLIPSWVRLDATILAPRSQPG